MSPDADPPWPFSRESTIRVDRDGHFWHDGQRVEHPGLERAFARWLDVDEATGRVIVKNAINWVYVRVDDAPLVVRGVREEGGRLLVHLSDDSVEPLDPQTLRLGAGDVPYCRARGGKLAARFSWQAAIALLERGREDGDAVVLELPGGQVRLTRVIG